jgi:ABC-type branched-subunit amino acid transport system ATPase component
VSALVASGVAVRFGGLHALKGVSVTVGEGEVVGLIGGNGAGKTTFMDCVSGYVQPEPGSSIVAFGNELVGLPPEMRPYLDVGRSYQHARLFPGLTVTEALLVAFERHQPTGVLSALLGLAGAAKAEKAKRAQVDSLLETMGLVSYRDKLVKELSTGTRRVLDIASILAQRPRLLLLDEPTAGLAQRETEAFGPLIRRVRDQLGCAVLIIEHDIVLISSLCDRVYALESGAVIASGPPDVVRSDPRVIASYLGTDEAAIARSGALAAAAPAPARPRRRDRPLRATRA